MTSSSIYKPSGIRFGAAYYLEYQPGDTLDRDLDLMSEAGFTVIRVGESVWSTWEPRNGVFELDWLQPVLDGAHARGIGVILGTPTYAVPPWLANAYPEIAGETASGQRHPWGARQEVDVTHPGFRFHAERVIRKVVARYADHPAVIGFQVDNEPGPILLHNRGTFERFIEWLKDRYGTVEQLNREWGLVYWSHRLSDWRELWTPEGNAQPQYDLAWRRFQAECISEFIGWQADIVREYARTGQFVTTCVALDRPAADERQLNERLDVTATNPYYSMQDHLARTQSLSRPDVWMRTGTNGLLELADRSYGAKQARFLVTETNAQAIGSSSLNLPPYPGQLQQAGLALVARGAAMIEYWHWHTNHFGTETYWGGVLPHSQRPGRVYRELAELGRILAKLGDRLDGYVPDADVTLLYATDSKYALSFQPPFAPGVAGSVGGFIKTNPAAYHDVVNAFHGGACDADAQVRVLHAEQADRLSVEELVAQHPVLVAAGFYTATTQQLERLRDYAAAGGHLVLGIRTGYGDEEARARVPVAPDVVGEPAGVSYDEFTTLLEPLGVRGEGMDLSDGAAALHWADGVVADDRATVLARYDHPVFGEYPTVTTAPHGEGWITYVGTVPNRDLAADLMRHLLPSPLTGAWTRDPSVTVLSGVARGVRYYFVHNWSGTTARVTPPADMVELTQDLGAEAGVEIELTSWQSLIFTAK
ncbi:beta-galactosidase [Tessaracoccus sp. G1721]